MVGAVLLSIIGAIISGNTPKMGYGEDEVRLFSVQDTPYNQTFAHWVDKWMNWHLSFPISLRENYSSTECHRNQYNEQPVWMLADGRDLGDNEGAKHGEVRSCEVPAGKAMLVQIVGSNCSTDEFKDHPATDQELLECAQWILPLTRFSASIDGVQVMNSDKNPNDKEKFYVVPFRTNLTYPNDNKYDATPGTFKGMVAGYFLFIRPLEIGSHTINFYEGVEGTFENQPYSKRYSNVTYNLDVVNTTRQQSGRD